MNIGPGGGGELHRGRIFYGGFWGTGLTGGREGEGERKKNIIDQAGVEKSADS